MRVLETSSAVAPFVFPSCCGLPAINAGYREPARRMAKQTIEAIEASGVDTIVSTSTSCLGAIRHDYPRLLRDEPEWRERGLAAARRMVDFATYVETHGAHDPAHATAARPGDRARRLPVTSWARPRPRRCAGC